MNERDGGSLYDFVDDDYVAPVQEVVKKTPVIGEVNHQANRPDGELTYRNNLQFQQKVDSAPTNAAPKTSAIYEWGLLIANRDSSNFIAIQVNKLFVRNNIHGDNLGSEKARYLTEYKRVRYES